MTKISDRIRELRKQHGFTQEELALRLDVTPQAISKWERGAGLPDLSILAELCKLLHVSADSLLDIHDDQITENHDSQTQEEILLRLQYCLEPLTIRFGADWVQVFMEDESYVPRIAEKRKILAGEGILMPIVRICDDMRLEDNEIIILSYDRILYREALQDMGMAGCAYVVDVLEMTVREHYGLIISPDIIKTMTDNLRHRYPALIDGVVPERISYGMLKDILVQFMARGNGPKYLVKVIEIAESVLREQPGLSATEVAEMVSEKLETPDNLYVYLAERNRHI